MTNYANEPPHLRYEPPHLQETPHLAHAFLTLYTFVNSHRHHAKGVDMLEDFFQFPDTECCQNYIG